MKKIIVQAFQQKYYLPAKVKEKSATYLKNVQKVGKHLSTIKMMKKANTRKQNHHLSLAQRFVISFVYNCIWKRIACSFIDLITPSIVKSKQLTKITDYRNHIGFSQGTELLLNTRGESFLKCQSTSIHTNIAEKVFKCTNIIDVNSGHTFSDSLTKEDGWKVDNKRHSKSVTSNGVQYLNENYENIPVIPNKESLIPQLNDLKHQKNDVDLECFHEKNINNNIMDQDKNGLSLAVPCSKTNSPGSNDMQKNNCKECNPVVSNSTLQYYKDCFDRERPGSVKWVKPSRIKGKNVGKANKYNNQKTSNDLPKGSTPEGGTDSNLPIKTSPTRNYKKGNRRRNERAKEKMEAEVYVHRKPGRYLKLRENRNNKWYSGLAQNDQQHHVKNPSFNRKRFPKNVSEIGVKHNNLQESDGYSFFEKDETFEEITRNKSKADKGLIQQEPGIRLQIDNEVYNKRMIKTNQNVKEDSHFSKMQNKTSFLLNELVKTNKDIKSKSSKSYKKIKRKASFEKKLKNIISQTQITNEFQSNNKKGKINISGRKTDNSNTPEEYKLKNTASPLNESHKIRSDITKNYLKNRENSLSECRKSTNQDQLGLCDSSATNPDMVRTNLVVFDIVQDEAQLLVQEQSLGKNIKSNLINLNTVITEENSQNVSKKSHKKIEKPIANNDCSLDEMKLIKNYQKNIKPVAEKPWKRGTSAGSRNRTKNTHTLSDKLFNSGASIYHQKYDNNKKDEAQHVLTNTSPSTADVSSDTKLNNSPLGKTLSASNVYNKNKQESLSPKKTKSAEWSISKVSLPRKSQTTQINDKNTSKHNYLSNEDTISKTGSTNHSNKEHKEQKKGVTDNFSEKKTSVANGNEQFIKSDKVISVKQKLDTPEIQVKFKPKDNSYSTKNGDRTHKESDIKVVSSTRPTQHVTSSTVGTNSKRENKSEKQIRLQEVKTPAAYSNPKTNNLEKKVPATFPRTNIGLESMNDAYIYDKNKTKDVAGFQNPVTSKPKSLLKSSNKTNLAHNDLLVSKTVADINQGLNELFGKEEFKSKMNKLLHNFTVTGQNQQSHNIQRRIKSQEIVITKHGKEQKSNKTIRRESDVLNKSISNEELNVKLKNNKSSNIKSNSVTNKINNIKVSTKTNDLSGNNGVQGNILTGKPNTNKPLTVSVRPALEVPKDKKPHENMTKSGEKNTQRQPVVRVRNTTNIVPPSKIKTTVSNKSESTTIETTSHREVKQQVPATSHLKNNDVDKKGPNPTMQATQVDNVSTKTEMLRKILKKRPTE